MAIEEREQKIVAAADTLRSLLKAYQTDVGVEAAKSFADRLTPLAADIEDVLVGIELE